jgi:rhamnulokinase
MKESRHIAIDLGAESGRVVASFVFEDSFRMEEVHRFTTGGLRVCGNLHWNVYRFWEEILMGIRLCTEKWGGDFASIGVDAWGVDFTLLDNRGEPVGLPYHYRDQRTENTPEIIEEVMGAGRLYDKTGIQLLVINTLNQLIAMKRQGSDTLEQGKNIHFIGDLFHYFLSGVRCTEYTVASISQLINTQTCAWEDEIFEAFGIPNGVKNRIVQAGETLGTVLPEIAEMTGLSKQCLVISPAVHDTASAAATIPSEGSDWAYISTGTWIMAGFEISEPLVNEESCAMNISNSGGVFGTSLFLRNTMGLWIIQQCKSAWNRDLDEHLDYPDIVKEVEATAEEEEYIDPDHPSFLNPVNMVEAVRDYLRESGQAVPGPEEVGIIAKIVYESLAFKIRYIFELLSKTLNRGFSTIHAIGGGIQNRIFLQMVADSLGKRVVAGPVEASAAGNSMMQAYGCGRFRNHAEIRAYLRKTIVVEKVIPNVEKHAVIEKRYRSFLHITGLPDAGL